MNKAKAVSKLDGKAFLREALLAEQRVLALQLELSSKSITHDGVMGDVNEQHFIQYLRSHLPSKYAADQGIIIDSNGATSDQIDVVIYDHQYTPTLLDQYSHRYIPAEAVYCVLEVKPTINKQYLDYAAAKANSVRILERTSVVIHGVAGQIPAKPQFEIVAGIVAINTEWNDGLAATAFETNLSAHKEAYRLDCGLSLNDKSFDTFDGSLTLSNQEGSLASFLFRLLRQLHKLGNVPAVDWNKYAAVLSN